MPDVARAALAAPVQCAARDQARPDPGADLDVEEVAGAPGGPRPQFAQGHHIDLVVHPHRRVVPGGEPVAHRVAVPPRHDRRRAGPAGRELDRPGQPDPDAPDGGLRHLLGAHPVEQVVEERLHAVEHRVRPLGDVGGLGVLGQHRARQVGDPDAEARGAELGGEDDPGPGTEPQLTRSAATARRTEFALLDQPPVGELADPLGDHGASEAGEPADLGTGSGRPRAHQVQHRGQAVEVFGHGHRPRGRSGLRHLHPHHLPPCAGPRIPPA